MTEETIGFIFSPEGDCIPTEGHLSIEKEGKMTFGPTHSLNLKVGWKMKIQLYRKAAKDICELDFSFAGEFEAEVIQDSKLEITKKLQQEIRSPTDHVLENAEAAKRFVENYNQNLTENLFENLTTAFLAIQGGKVPIIEKVSLDWKEDRFVISPENQERMANHFPYNKHVKLFVNEHNGIENIEILGIVSSSSEGIYIHPTKLSYGKHTEMETRHLSQKQSHILIEEMKGIFSSLKFWWRVTRGDLAAFGILSGITGIAWLRETSETVDWFTTIKILLMMICLFLASNLLNDYFDSLKDEYNPFGGPLHGGSGAIQHDLITREQILIVSLILGVVGSILALDLLIEKWSPLILALGTVAVIIAILFSAPPFRLGSRGAGEILLSLEIGILPLIGTYLYLANRPQFTVELTNTAAYLFSILFSWFLLSNIMDLIPDIRAEKKTLAVILGQKKALVAFKLTFMLSTLIWAIMLILQQLQWGIIVGVIGTLLSYNVLRPLQVPLQISKNRNLIERIFKTILFQIVVLDFFIIS